VCQYILIGTKRMGSGDDMRNVSAFHIKFSNPS